MSTKQSRLAMQIFSSSRWKISVLWTSFRAEMEKFKTPSRSAWTQMTSIPLPPTETSRSVVAAGHGQRRGLQQQRHRGLRPRGRHRGHERQRRAHAALVPLPRTAGHSRPDTGTLRHARGQLWWVRAACFFLFFATTIFSLVSKSLPPLFLKPLIRFDLVTSLRTNSSSWFELITGLILYFIFLGLISLDNISECCLC